MASVTWVLRTVIKNSLDERLAEIRQRLSDFRPWLEGYLLRQVRAEEEQIYETEGSVTPVPWPANRGWYANYKLSTGRTKVGVFDGLLREQLVNGPTDITSHRLVLGPDPSVVPYATWMQHGTSRMPARPFMPHESWWMLRHGVDWKESLGRYVLRGEVA